MLPSFVGMSHVSSSSWSNTRPESSVLQLCHLSVSFRSTQSLKDTNFSDLWTTKISKISLSWKENNFYAKKSKLYFCLFESSSCVPWTNYHHHHHHQHWYTIFFISLIFLTLFSFWYYILYVFSLLICLCVFTPSVLMYFCFFSVCLWLAFSYFQAL
jgi:hypothetical protein